MATLRDIRRKIQSIKKTEQITKAMKMVSAAKLRRTQDETLKIRPYYTTLGEVLKRIVANLEEVDDPLITGRNGSGNGCVGVMVITSEKGLCGSFNHNLGRRAEAFLKELEGSGKSYKLYCFGKKGRDYLSKEGFKVDLYWPNPGRYELIPFQEVFRVSIESYKNGEIDEFYFVYPFFRSPISQPPQVERFIPFTVEKEENGKTKIEHLFEPNKKEALRALINTFLEVRIRTIFLEAITSEHAARMTAMENASKNAGELIKKLTLQYNKARQEAITKELLDIVNAAEAIKKGGR